MGNVPVGCLFDYLELGLGRKGVTSLSILAGFFFSLDSLIRHERLLRCLARYIDKYLYLQFTNRDCPEIFLQVYQREAVVFLVQYYPYHISGTSCCQPLVMLLLVLLSFSLLTTAAIRVLLLQAQCHRLQNALPGQVLIPTPSNVGTEWCYWGANVAFLQWILSRSVI